SALRDPDGLRVEPFEDRPESILNPSLDFSRLRCQASDADDAMDRRHARANDHLLMTVEPGRRQRLILYACASNEALAPGHPPQQSWRSERNVRADGPTRR